MYLLILCAVTTGCGPSAEQKADPQRLDAARNAAENREQAAEKRAAEKRAAEKEAAEEKAAQKKADEKKAAEEKAAANGYVKIKVEVELRGVLSCTEEGAIISVDKEHGWVFDFGKGEKKYGWELDFGEDKEMRAKAKALDGKTVLVEGSAILQYQKGTVESGPFSGRRGGDMTVSVLDLGPKVAVKSLVAAPKE
jgi:hypothetical protein